MQISCTTSGREHFVDNDVAVRGGNTALKRPFNRPSDIFQHYIICDTHYMIILLLTLSQHYSHVSARFKIAKEAPRPAAHLQHERCFLYI